MKKLSFIIFYMTLAQMGLCQSPDLILNVYNNETTIKAANSITLKNGFYIPAGKNVVLLVGGFPNLVSQLSADRNYILTKTFRSAVKETQVASVRSIDLENQSIQYFDGLGRLVQTVQLMASPTYKDIVQHVEYDALGRETVKYLPHVGQLNNDGSFKTTSAVDQLAYYGLSNTWDPAVTKTAQPFAVSVLENGPLSRVTEQGAPGVMWQPISNRGSATTTGRTVAMDYGANIANDVRLWKVTATGGASSTAYYAVNTLSKKVVKDENWTSAQGRAGTVEEYSDMAGRTVLKRVWETTAKSLNTYYVYDDMGDLRYVIPPIVTEITFSELATDAFFEKYIYAYHYDGLRRLTKKKIPGKGWEYMAYNGNNQVVLQQDALQRATGSWSYTKYDAFGNVAYSGIYVKAGMVTQAAAQLAVDSHPLVNGIRYQSEERIGTLDYTDRAFPTIGTTMPHITNYYDDYTFRDANLQALQAVNITKSSNTKTLLTGTRVTTTDGTAPLLTINYYDDRARLIQTVSQNQLSGTDYVTNTYNFPGELLTSKREHKAVISGATKTLSVLTSNSYDHVGRLKEARKKVGSQAEIVQSSLAYNEIGQLKEKDLHGTGSSAAQQIVYSYNERGWLKAINDPAGVSTKKRFGMTLAYGNNARAYNGNIGSVQWNTLVAPGQTQTPVQSYVYNYDALGRLKKAAYSATNKVNFYNEELAYDVMGNIDTLRRSNGATSWYNHFKYTYLGNQLTKVTDAGTALRTNNFTYDANGNGRTNLRLGITDIQYNYLNLPKQFVKGAENLLYTYDALGRKLTKQLGTANITQYIGGIQYKNGTLEFIQTEEGRILPNGSSFIYEYFLKDHLGNTRAVVDQGGTVKQIQDYYAFGMEMNQGNALNTASNLYKYNGKEKQMELGLDQLDYGARFYDAEIGRFNVIDRFAEKYHESNSYHYALNNPANNIDINGDSVYVAKEHRENMNNALKSVYGDNASKFGYNDNGMLTYSGDTKGFTKEQAALYKGLSEIMGETTTTNMVFGETTTITMKDGTTGTVRAAEGGGAVTVLIGENDVSQNTILIDPKTANTPVSVFAITDAYYKKPIDPANGARFEQKTVPGNIGTSMFHELGHVIFRGQTQNKVLDYENKARKQMNLPKRPYDETHNSTVKKGKYGN